MGPVGSLAGIRPEVGPVGNLADIRPVEGLVGSNSDSYCSVGGFQSEDCNGHVYQRIQIWRLYVFRFSSNEFVRGLALFSMENQSFKQNIKQL